jgi:acyl CoA:acetate/3-ketoacid CoA transferase beta subunit
MNTVKTAAIIVLLLGIVGLGVGGAFVGVGFAKNNQVSTYLRAEKVTLGISPADVAKGKVVDSLATAQTAALALTKDRQSIAPTYNALLAGGKFDPTNLTQLTYAQAMNLQTNIYTAVLAFGLAQSIMANGAFMLATGIALIVVGLVLYKLSKKTT